MQESDRSLVVKNVVGARLDEELVEANELFLLEMTVKSNTRMHAKDINLSQPRSSRPLSRTSTDKTHHRDFPSELCMSRLGYSVAS